MSLTVEVVAEAPATTATAAVKQASSSTHVNSQLNFTAKLFSSTGN